MSKSKLTLWEGSFEWGGVNFSDSAEEISFAIEGDGVPILRAGLRNVEGELVYRDINLAERIGNNDGNFQFGKFSIARSKNLLTN